MMRIRMETNASGLQEAAEAEESEVKREQGAKAEIRDRWRDKICKGGEERGGGEYIRVVRVGGEEIEKKGGYGVG